LTFSLDLFLTAPDDYSNKTCQHIHSIKQIKTNHKKEIVTENEVNDAEKKNCNCTQAKTCPLGGKCRSSTAFYQAIMTKSDKNKQEMYVR